MRNTSVTRLAIAVAFTSVLTGGVAVASSPQTYSRTVRVADLDLSTEQGADAALRRIRRAAQYVCGDEGSNAHVLWASSSYRSCVRQASDKAIADLGHPMVTARSNGAKPVQIAGK